MIGVKKMTASEAQKRATKKWQDEKTDLIKFRVPKGKKAKYQDLAKKSGVSLTAYITSVLDEKLEKEEH